jgi:hypothetical protein
MSLIEVGKPIRLGEHSDTGSEVSNRAECKLSKAEIYPVKYSISFADLFDNTPGPAIKYNYGEAMSDLAKKFASVGLGGIGIKCWLNDSTSGNMSVSNNMKDNVMVEKINNISNTSAMQKLTSLRDSIRSGGGGLPNPAPNNAIANVFLEGKHLSLPQIWESTSYDSSVNFSISLITPYGSKRAVMEHITKPLAAIFCMAAGMSYDGITYGNPGYVTVIAPGVGFIQLGMLNVSYGSSLNEEEKNLWGQPLTVNLSFTITSAVRGFAAAVNGDMATVGSAMSPASPTNSGLAINTPGSIINSMRPSKFPCSAANKANGSSSFSSSGGGGGAGTKASDINGINVSGHTNGSGVNSSGDFKSMDFNEFVSNMTPNVTKDPYYSNVRYTADDLSKKLEKAIGKI